MRPRELAILAHLEAVAATVVSLGTSFPKASLYRSLKNLLRRQLVVLEGGARYALTAAGRAALELSRRAPATLATRPRLPLPHLEDTPTPFHRSVLELVACSIALRWNKVKPAHHAAYVVIGPPLRFTTWIAEAACRMAGVDPTRGVIYLPKETGQSLTTRRDARGAKVTVRAALSQPVVGLDELARAKPPIRRLAELYLHGRIAVSDEDATLEVLPVPIATMNPVATSKPGDTLEARTGLDPAMLRRAIVVDVSAVEIPRGVRSSGGDLLDRMEARGPAAFPAPRAPDFDTAERIGRVLERLFDAEERLGGIDLTLLSQLAIGATAWLEPEDALRLVLLDYCEVTAPLGWYRADWQARLAEALDPEPDRGAAPEEPTPPAPITIDDVAAVLGRLGLSSQQAMDRLTFAGEIEQLGFTVEGAALVARELRRVDSRSARGLDVLVHLLREHGSLARSASAFEAVVKDAADRLAALRAAVREEEARLERMGTSPPRETWDDARFARMIAEQNAKEVLRRVEERSGQE